MIHKPNLLDDKELSMDRENINKAMEKGGQEWKERPDDEINLMDLFAVIWRWKYLVVGIALFALIATFGYTRVRYPVQQVAEAFVTLSFSGIEKSQNPDGSLFERNQIITPMILRNALESLGPDAMKERIRDLLNEKLRSMVSVYSVRPGKKAGEEKEILFPNRFRIVLTADEKEGVGSKLMADILPAIVEAYKQRFAEKYADTPLVVFSQDLELTSKSDYDEIVTIIKMRLDSMIEQIRDRVKGGGYYLSKETGDSFGGLMLQAQIILQTQVNRIEAILRSLNITKDKDARISRLRHRIEQIGVRQQKKAAEAMSARELLREVRLAEDVVAKERPAGTTTNLMIDSSFIENIRKSDYYAFLLKTALEAEVSARNDEVEIRHIENVLKKIIANGADHDEVEKKRTQVELSLGDMLGSVDKIARKFNRLNSEFVRSRIDGSIQMVREPEILKRGHPNRKRLPVLAFFMAGFLAVMIAFFVEAVLRRKAQDPAG